MSKSTDVVITQRVQAIYERLLDGYSRSDIIQYCSTEKYDISDRQVDTYIKKATELIRGELDDSRELVYKKHIRRREKLYKKALQAGNYKVANTILDSMAKIDGSVIDRKSIDLSGNLGNQNISDEELDKLIQAEINKGKDGISTQGQ